MTELFSEPPGDHSSAQTQRNLPMTVSQLNQRARNLLERQFASVSVIGEVSNFKVVSGHCYFTLKDAGSQLPAVLFRREARALKFELRPGMEVVATGRLTIYGPYGRYQIVCDRIEPRGAGALQAAFEQLREKLQAEGLFAPERKRPLPLLPGRVAVVTSPTGAVIRDIINVSTRRYPAARLLVIPSRVQGAESAPSIAGGIERASERAVELGLDVIVVARGGGSLEDLWGFNDERVARAIVAAPVPVVSAVGHETDFTIADFVADQRAPTPSAAAELVFPIRSDLMAALRRPIERGSVLLRRDIEQQRHRLRSAVRAMGDARMLVRHYAQRLAYAEAAISQVTQRTVMQRRLALKGVEERLAALHPRARLAQSRARLEAAYVSAVTAYRRRLAGERSRLAVAARSLHTLSPLGVLERGYAIALGPTGEALKDAQQISPGDTVDIRLARGSIRAVVESSQSTDDAGS